MYENSAYNPDVLTCLANLSSDEVFTPPEIVNKMLDELPADLFENETTTFLDPSSKSGVFLREIAKRLIVGLEGRIPNLEERINHIFSRQIFGIATTELTSLISRRTTYCAKKANSKFSIAKSLATNLEILGTTRVITHGKMGNVYFVMQAKPLMEEVMRQKAMHMSLFIKATLWSFLR